MFGFAASLVMAFVVIVGIASVADLANACMRKLLRSAIWSKPILFGCSALVLLALAGCGGQAQQEQIQAMDCVVIDPSDVYPSDYYQYDYFNDEMIVAVEDLFDADDAYDTAIYNFSDIASSLDADDDRDFIAKNNLGCALLKSAGAGTAAARSSTNTIAAQGFMPVSLQSSTSQSSAGWDSETCRQGYNQISSAWSDLHDADERNQHSLEAGDGIDCSRPVRVDLIHEPLQTPAVTLYIWLPQQERAKLASVDAIIGGADRMISLPNSLLPDSDKRKFYAKINLPAEDVYCYELSSVPRTTFSEVQEALEMTGALLIDTGEELSSGPLVKDYFVKAPADFPASPAQLQEGNRDSFAVEIHAHNLMEGEWKRIEISFNGEPLQPVVLTSENREEIVEVDLLSVAGSPATYSVTVDGSPVDAGRINSLSNGNIFRVEIDDDQAFFERLTCHPDGYLLDIGQAVYELETVVRAMDNSSAGDVRVAEAVARALQLIDPQSDAISSDTWNYLCRWAALGGHERDVVNSACDLAVKLAVPDTPGYYSALDSRGLARALDGRIQDAIDDFQTVLTDGYYIYSDESRFYRQRWVEMLPHVKQQEITIEDLFFDSETRDLLLYEDLGAFW